MVNKQRAFCFVFYNHTPHARAACASVRPAAGRPVELAGSAGGLGIVLSLVEVNKKRTPKAKINNKYPPLGLTHRLCVFGTEDEGGVWEVATHGTVQHNKSTEYDVQCRRGRFFRIYENPTTDRILRFPTRHPPPPCCSMGGTPISSSAVRRRARRRQPTLYRALHDGRPVFWCCQVLANLVTV